MTVGIRQNDERIIILAPTGKDAILTKDLLASAGLQSAICESPASLPDMIEDGAGLIFLAEEALSDSLITNLKQTLAAQPPWSDLPVILSTRAGGFGLHTAQRLRLLEHLPNASFVERPIRVMTLVSMVRAALAGRRRQYQARDLLEKERLSRLDAEKANRLKDEFLANVSHELRTPLNAMLGFSDLLMDLPDLEPDIREAIAAINRNAKAQLVIIDDLIDTARLIRGQFQMNMEPVDLLTAIKGAIESTMLSARARNIQIITHLFKGSAPLRGDLVRLQQIVWNLLANAVKFTPEGGRIEIRLTRDESCYVLTVTDNGIGIEADFLPSIFDTFRQQDGSLTRKYGGLGLGLSIARSLVEMHGGTITCTSQGRGKGATFEVRLPLHSSPDEALSKGDQSLSNGNSIGQMARLKL